MRGEVECAGGIRPGLPVRPGETEVRLDDLGVRVAPDGAYGRRAVRRREIERYGRRSLGRVPGDGGGRRRAGSEEQKEGGEEGEEGGRGAGVHVRHRTDLTT